MSSKVAVLFCIPTSNESEFLCSTALPAFGGVSILDFNHSDRRVVVLHSVTFICMILFSVLAINFSTVLYILISGLAGIIVYLVGQFRKEDKK